MPPTKLIDNSMFSEQDNNMQRIKSSMAPKLNNLNDYVEWAPAMELHLMTSGLLSLLTADAMEDPEKKYGDKVTSSQLRRYDDYLLKDEKA